MTATWVSATATGAAIQTDVILPHRPPEASSLAPILRVRIRAWSRCAGALERRAVDRDEHDGLRPHRAMHPDGRCHGSRAAVDPLPHAARRPVGGSARCPLPF